jgi:DNA-binding response OmpR family regulator
MVKQTCLRSVTEFDGLLERRQSEAPTFKLVLMIEDNPALATRLAEMLLAYQADIQVIVASDCLTALKLLRSCAPDLMLVDERLLTHNGIDLTLRLRTMKDLQDIPLLFFSADFP